MRIHVHFIDRVGITRDVLSSLATWDLNLDGVEMAPPNVYLDAPTLAPEVLDQLRQMLLQIDGVTRVEVVDMLPGIRHRLHRDAMLAALTDPVLILGAQGDVLAANAATQAMTGQSESELRGRSLADLLGDAGLQGELVESGFQLPMREVMLLGEPFLLDAKPIGESGNAGGLLLLQSVSRIGERLHAVQYPNAAKFDSLLGDSEPFVALKQRAARVAPVDAPLLIIGETGTGKELIAHACHAASARHSAPFLALNCAAVPESLFESELFGYAPGSFSGAQRGGKPGLLELANHGTVFLDEVGEMSTYLQAKLLRFLSEGSFRRVGGEREQKVDVRILSATHRNLEQMVADGSFREDLFYRLNVLTLRVPPLRERGNDILLLARHFVEHACVQIQRKPCRLAPATYPALLANRWPGNVRQLQNILFRAAATCERSVIDIGDLDIAGNEVARADDGEVDSLQAAIESYERELLERLYPRYPSSRQLAGRLKTSHTAIANRLRKYAIPR